MKNTIKRRNLYLQDFFKENGFNVCLMGDYNNPLIVTTDNIVLSCYVNNFELICKDDPLSGNEVLRVELSSNPTIDYKYKLLSWFKTASHRKIYLFKSGGFWFSRFSNSSDEEYPLFTKSKSVAYYVFSRKKAIEVRQRLFKGDEKIEIIY